MLAWIIFFASLVASAVRGCTREQNNHLIGCFKGYITLYGQQGLITNNQLPSQNSVLTFIDNYTNHFPYQQNQKWFEDLKTCYTTSYPSNPECLDVDNLQNIIATSYPIYTSPISNAIFYVKLLTASEYLFDDSSTQTTAYCVFDQFSQVQRMCGNLLDLNTCDAYNQFTSCAMNHLVSTCNINAPKAYNLCGYAETLVQRLRSNHDCDAQISQTCTSGAANGWTTSTTSTQAAPTCTREQNDHLIGCFNGYLTLYGQQGLITNNQLPSLSDVLNFMDNYVNHFPYGQNQIRFEDLRTCYTTSYSSDPDCLDVDNLQHIISLYPAYTSPLSNAIFYVKLLTAAEYLFSQATTQNNAYCVFNQSAQVQNRCGNLLDLYTCDDYNRFTQCAMNYIVSACQISPTDAYNLCENYAQTLVQRLASSHNCDGQITQTCANGGIGWYTSSTSTPTTLTTTTSRPTRTSTKKHNGTGNNVFKPISLILMMVLVYLLN